MGQWLTKESFLQQAIMLGMDEYVDWASGKVHFDTGAFAQLLEFANMFPADYDWDTGFYDNEFDFIATGRQIMVTMSVGDFNYLQMYRAMFGGDIVFKGFPTENRNGNSLEIMGSLAITTSATDKEAAWEFMRTTLAKDWQSENITWSFPTNKSAFDELVVEAMKEPEHDWSWGFGRDGSVQIGATTQAEIDQVMELINNASGIASYDEALMNIIMEGAQDFFSGRSSAQDAARIIQNRANIYISEQS